MLKKYIFVEISIGCQKFLPYIKYGKKVIFFDFGQFLVWFILVYYGLKLVWDIKCNQNVCLKLIFTSYFNFVQKYQLFIAVRDFENLSQIRNFAKIRQKMKISFFS